MLLRIARDTALADIAGPNTLLPPRYAQARWRGMAPPPQPDPSRETVLLLGNYRPALAAARSLSMHGDRVIMGLGGGEGCTEYSRFVDETWDHPPLSGSGDAFLAALTALLEARSDISVVYPLAEEFVRLFAGRQQALPDRIVVASPGANVVQTCCDKLALLRLAERSGVDHLPYRVANSLTELPDAAREVGFPVVIRPLNNNLVRLGHKKALIATDQAELEKLIPRWPDGQDSLLLQRHAKGERQDLFFAAFEGRILRAAQVRYLRTDHIDGTGLCVHGEIQVLNDRLVGHCRALSRALGYTGIGCAQFVVDPVSNDICFFELNPRTSAIHRVPEAVGMELSRAAIALARGSIPPALLSEFRYEAGQRYAWTYGDLRGLVSALRHSEISPVLAARWFVQTLWSAITADFHLTWRRDDPWPTIMLFLRQLGLGRTSKSTAAATEERLR